MPPGHIRKSTNICGISTKREIKTSGHYMVLVFLFVLLFPKYVLSLIPTLEFLVAKTEFTLLKLTKNISYFILQRIQELI